MKTNATSSMQKIDEENPPKGFSVKCENPLLRKRITRAANFNGRTAREYCWFAIASSVSCSEGDMIFGPTGKVIGDRLNQTEEWAKQLASRRRLAS